MAEFKKRERKTSEIPTSSMADIAFLLLIFFLVTTTIDVDTGIGMVLPPKLEDVEPPPIKERNMLKILVNEQGRVLVEDKPSSVQLIRQAVKDHVLNYGADPNLAEDPGSALISIKTAQETHYSNYVDVLDEVWMAYFEIWDSKARERGYPDYATYKAAIGEEEGAVDEIRDEIKAAISIAEPDE